jgi:hypothetical protein
MTGEGAAQDPIDAKEFHMLKETLLAVFQTKTCGRLTPPATA